MSGDSCLAGKNFEITACHFGFHDGATWSNALLEVMWNEACTDTLWVLQESSLCLWISWSKHRDTLFPEDRSRGRTLFKWHQQEHCAVGRGDSVTMNRQVSLETS